MILMKGVTITDESNDTRTGGSLTNTLKMVSEAELLEKLSNPNQDLKLKISKNEFESIIIPKQ